MADGLCVAHVMGKCLDVPQLGLWLVEIKPSLNCGLTISGTDSGKKEGAVLAMVSQPHGSGTHEQQPFVSGSWRITSSAPNPQIIWVLLLQPQFLALCGHPSPS